MKSKRIPKISTSSKCLCIYIKFLKALKKTYHINMFRSKTPFFPKELLTPSTFLLYLWKYFINQNENYIFMIRRDWNFCDVLLQAAVILHRKVKSFHLPLGHGFSTMSKFNNIFSLEWLLHKKKSGFCLFYDNFFIIF